ncbi:hypothetical protein ACM66B_003030 [Microbotryomycetes sp. NB124-2]
MFAPLTAAVRSASQVRQTAEHTAETVADHVREDVQVARHLVDRARNEDPLHDETPQEAEDELHDEYRPLMQDNDGDECENGQRGRTRHRNQKHANGGAQTIERRTRKVEVAISYSCFFVLGACILLSWNSQIVASSYFGARLKGSSFETSYASWVAMSFTTGNLVFLAHANATQAGANLKRRIVFSIVALTAIVVMYIISTRIPRINVDLFFGMLIVSTLALSACASYLQNAVVALSASFGPIYLQGILSGQGAIALIVAGIQLISAYAAMSSELASRSGSSGLVMQPGSSSIFELLEVNGPQPQQGILDSAFSFFVAIAAFAVLSLLAYLLLLNLPLYKVVIRASEDDSDSDDKGPRASLRVVERKVRKLGISVFLTFLVTLAVFPSITSTILSVNQGKMQPGTFGDVLTQPAVFLPIGFLFFALGDWIGRVLPQAKILTFTDWRALLGLSLARVVFIPLFLICNTSTSAGGALIKSDAAYLVIMLLFSLTNGYGSTLVMLAAVVEPSLEEHEVDVAATCMAFYLTL